MKGISGLISVLKSMDENNSKSEFKVGLKQKVLYTSLFWFYPGIYGYGPWGT